MHQLEDNPNRNDFKKSEAAISWLSIIILVALAGLVTLLAHRVNSLQNSLIEFSSHLDEHLSAIEAGSNIKNPDKPFTGELNINNAPSRGNIEASEIVIVEFSDFECPYCAQSTLEINRLLEKYPDQLALIHKDYPLPSHKNADEAAVAARCAGTENKYWEMYDMIFQNQQHLDNENLMAFASSLGLDKEAFKTCLGDGRMADLINVDLNDGLELKIDATPTFIVGTRGPVQENKMKISGFIVTMNDLSNKVDQLLVQE